MNVYSQKHKKGLFFFKFFLFIFFIVAAVFGIAFLNYHFKARNINITFFDDKTENQDIKTFAENLIRQNSNSFYGFLFLDQEDITKQIHNEYEIVSDVEISRSLNLDLNVTIQKNQEFFYTCVPDSLGFLAPCMLGNTDGEYYAEFDQVADESTTTSSTSTDAMTSGQATTSDVATDPSVGKLRIDINPKVLYDANTEKKLDSPDSLSGSRIYTDDDFKILREDLKWVQNNGFTIKKVYVDELKIVSIYTDQYEIIISLDKPFVDTVKDFELISRTGNLEKYINDEKDKIDYIDLSYKNKVFYKLKGAGTNSSSTTDFISASSSALTSTTTATSTR